jgi:4-amino-4-deoxy-L-arabinose transferase-like glycosyltransferase
MLRKHFNLCTALQAAALVVFAAAGVLLIPLLGFEDDELIFVNLFWHPNECFSRVPLGGNHGIPIMAMSYLGAFKTWLYGPLLALAAPTVWLVRLPALLLAILTIALAGRLMTVIEGRMAAAVIVCLLGTDVTFLFTATFDWGPVVLQHLLLVVSLLLLILWYREQNQRLLFLGGLAVGLALWDKSLFLWQLSGMSVAFFLVAFPVLRKVLRRRNIWMFTRGLLLGALPLIGANFRHHFATIKDNGHMTVSGFSLKAAFLRSAIDGQPATAFLIDGAINAMDQIHRPLETVGLALTRDLGHAPSLWRFYPAW